MRYVLILLLITAAAGAQQPPPPAPPADLSGMYTFLQDGEFVQLSVENGRLSGFISRFADREKSLFLDHFFTDTTLNGNELGFKTKTVHGVWFDFKGHIERGEGKKRSDEAYYVVRGTLTQFSTDANKKVSAASREVAFKSFPEEAEGEPTEKK